MRLKDFLPSEASYTHESFIEKHGDKRIIKVFDGTESPFPDIHGKYRNVMRWVILDDGSAVGWNESPRSGWGFPRIGKKAVERYQQLTNKRYS